MAVVIQIDGRGLSPMNMDPQGGNTDEIMAELAFGKPGS